MSGASFLKFPWWCSVLVACWGNASVISLPTSLDGSGSTLLVSSSSPSLGVVPPLPRASRPTLCSSASLQLAIR